MPYSGIEPRRRRKRRQSATQPLGLDRSMTRWRRCAHVLPEAASFRCYALSNPLGTMAKSVSAFSFKNGFREQSIWTPWATERKLENGSEVEEAHYVTPPSSEVLTSTVHNDLGLNVLRTWPTIYDGTNTPHDLPEWWSPSSEVDVLICGGKKSVLGQRLPILTMHTL